MNMKKIYITGVSGTGKTTIAKELKKRGFYTVSIDEVDGLCSWIHQETGENDGGKEAEMSLEFVDKHDWICDTEYLNNLLDKDVDSAFVLGMATNQDDFLHIFNKILFLQCSPETFCKRIENRTDKRNGDSHDCLPQLVIFRLTKMYLALFPCYVRRILKSSTTYVFHRSKI